MTQTITVPEALLFAGKTFDKLGTDGPQGIHGYYERGRNGNVKLYKLDSTLEACIIDNHRQGHFVVSAGMRSGRPFYMFSTSTLTDRWLGMEGWGMQSEADAIEAIRYVPYDKLSQDSTADLASPVPA